MKSWSIPLLFALFAPTATAAPETVAEVLHDLAAHGYTAPGVAVQRLRDASDANDPHAPIEQRRRYYNMLIALSLPVIDEKLLQESLTALDKLANEQRCTPCRVSWLIGKARGDTTQQHLTQAAALLDQAAPMIAAADRAGQMQFAIAQAYMFRARGTLDLAYDQGLKALALAEQLGDQATHVQVLILLAVLDVQRDFLDRAVTRSEVALKQANAMGFTAAIGRIYVAQDYIFKKRKEYDRQRHALQQAIKIADSTPGLSFTQTYARINLSDWYLQRDDYATALKTAQQAIPLAHARQDTYAEAVAVANVGVAEARLGRRDAALVSLQKALQLASQAGRLQLETSVNRERVGLLKQAGRYKEALEALQAMDDVDRKITQRERDNAVLELQAKYDDERKNREIEQLSAEARLTAAEATAQQWQLRLWTVLAGSALLTALVVVVRLLRARRANRRLVEDVASLTEQTSIDALTGAFNRRQFDQLIGPAAAQVEAHVGLVMLDIDHFKRINDSLGHDTGDVVLKVIAERLRALGRERDSVVRWGGEEFVLVLADAAPDTLPAMAERLLGAIANQAIRIGPRRVHASVSAGCVVHPLAPGSSWEQALKLADLAMYRSKREGRNRATCVTSISGPLADDLTDGDLAAAIRAGSIRITEVHGPALPDADHGLPTPAAQDPAHAQVHGS